MSLIVELQCVPEICVEDDGSTSVVRVDELEVTQGEGDGVVNRQYRRWPAQAACPLNPIIVGVVNVNRVTSNAGGVDLAVEVEVGIG